jgi:hypothetical protein
MRAVKELSRRRRGLSRGGTYDLSRLGIASIHGLSPVSSGRARAIAFPVTYTLCCKLFYWEERSWVLQLVPRTARIRLRYSDAAH